MHLLAGVLVHVQGGGPMNGLYLQRTVPRQPGRHRRHSRHLDTLAASILSLLGVALIVWAVLW